MIRKLLPLLLCLAMLLTAPLTVLAEEKEEGLVLSTAEEFLAFAENCRLDSYSLGLQVRLAADIDLTGLDFQGIPIFSGTLEGGGYTISGLKITRSGSVTGLFRYLTEEATVRDLKLSGAIGSGSGVTVGALAGTNSGRIENCSFVGSVSGSANVGGFVGINSVTGILEGCSAAGTLEGSHFIGGIVGANAGVIRDCRSEAAVNATSRENRVEIGDITLDAITGSENVAAVTDIGGIAGTSTGVIRNCENRGTVGYKHMGYNIGGIAGSQSGLIAECVNYGPVSGRKEVGGIVGHLQIGNAHSLHHMPQLLRHSTQRIIAPKRRKHRADARKLHHKLVFSRSARGQSGQRRIGKLTQHRGDPPVDSKAASTLGAKMPVRH